MKKTIGIIGGMGPMATAELFRMLISETAADSDRDHAHILVDCYPQIPDRTAAILEGGEDPVPYIIEAASRLERAGADILLISCHTSHCFYERISEGTSLPVLNMQTITARKLANDGIRRVGVLATDGSIKTGIFTRALAAEGVEAIYPDEDAQRTVMNVIYNGVKAGREIDLGDFFALLDTLRNKGAERILLGCTELPLLFANGERPRDLVDPMELLAKEALLLAGYAVKGS